MRIIELNASGWTTRQHFYDALLPSIGAPDWHGNNVNALIDSMIHGDINSVEAPYRVEVSGLNKADEDVFDELIFAFSRLSRHGAIAHFTSDKASVEIV